MQPFLIAIVMLISSIVGAAKVNADILPTNVPMQFSKIYFPGNFDDNDNVQIIGEFDAPNSCYKQADTLVNIDHESKTITVEPYSLRYDGMCLQMVVHFNPVINVGLLKEGVYKIKHGGMELPLGRFDVHHAQREEPDDFVYAPVSQAFFKNSPDGNKIIIEGEFSVSCMRLKEVRINFRGDVITVQPITEVDQTVTCEEGKFHFESVNDVGITNKGRYLMHVRTMNGNSINSVINVMGPTLTKK